MNPRRRASAPLGSASLRALSLALSALAACSSEASERPPTNSDPTDLDASSDASTTGSLITGGPFDAPVSTPDRPSVDARATVDATVDVTRDVTRDVTVDATVDVTLDVSVDATVDVSVDVPVDVARDATTDSGPVEVCGNGVDDDLDGAVDEDCPLTQCLSDVAQRTQVFYEGSAPPALTMAAATLGLTVHTGLPDLRTLGPAAILVVTISSPSSDARNTATRAWVEAGGALMTLMIGFGDGSPEECDGSNAILSRYGVSYDCVSTAPWGPVDEFFPHPITEGLTPDVVPFVNGRGVVARPGVAAAPLARIDDQIVGYASAVGCGRVIVWGDEHVGMPSYGSTPRLFWQRSLAWLSAAH